MPDLQQILSAFTKGDYKIVAALVVILVVQTLKTKGSKLIPALGKGYIAFLSAVVLSVAGAVANAIAAHAAVTLPLIIDGAEVGFMAAGGWSGFKALLEHVKAPKAPTPAPEPPPTPPAA